MAHGLPPSIDFILEKHKELQQVWAERNTEYEALRTIFDGDFAHKQETSALPAGLFNDKVKITYNIINAMVRRYMDSMSAPPRIDALPRGVEKEDIEKADARSKWLEKVYRANNMEMKIIQASYYQSLLDKAIWNVRPDPDFSMKIRIELAIPEAYMPMPKGDDWQKYPYLIYAFHTFEDPTGAVIQRDTKHSHSAQLFKNNIEYWDAHWYVRVKDNQIIKQIPHGLGRIPWHEAHNIPIPHRGRGQGDADQAVGLNTYLNMLISDEADIINYAANPITVVRGSKAGATNLPFAPRAVWDLERDGQAQFLQWAGSPPTVEAQILRVIQALEDATGVSSPAFGREIPSGVSGSAVRSLLAGFNTRIGTKQQLMGKSLAQVNETCMQMAEMIFPNEKFEVIGESTIGSSKAHVLMPREFDGWYENRVVFDPFDLGARFFQEMEKMNSKLQSKWTTMKNMGIPNPSDELKRIKEEAREEAERANELALGQKGELPGVGGLPSPVPGLPQTGSPGQIAPPDARAAQGGGPLGQAGIPEGEDPQEFARKLFGVPGGPKPGPFDQKGETEGAKLTVGDVLRKLRSVKGLQGGAALGGELAEKGATEDSFTIHIENSGDAKKLRRALGPLSSRAEFSSLPPSGKSIAIRPTIAGGGLPPRKITPGKAAPIAKPESKSVSLGRPEDLARLVEKSKLEAGEEWSVNSIEGGIRAQLHKVGDSVFVIGEGIGTVNHTKVKEIAEQMRLAHKGDVILDGEIVVDGDNTMSALQGKMRPNQAPRFMVWDVLFLDQDLTADPYGDRIDMFQAGTENIQLAHRKDVKAKDVHKTCQTMSSPGGCIVRSPHAALWATHLMHRVQKTIDVNAAVTKVQKTNTGAVVFEISMPGPDGVMQKVGKTQAQRDIIAQVGDTLRVSAFGASRKLNKKTKIFKHTLSEPMVRGLAKGKVDSVSIIEKIIQGGV